MRRTISWFSSSWNWREAKALTTSFCWAATSLRRAVSSLCSRLSSRSKSLTSSSHSLKSFLISLFSSLVSFFMAFIVLLLSLRNSFMALSWFSMSMIEARSASMDSWSFLSLSNSWSTSRSASSMSSWPSLATWMRASDCAAKSEAASCSFSSDSRRSLRSFSSLVLSSNCSFREASFLPFFCNSRMALASWSFSTRFSMARFLDSISSYMRSETARCSRAYTSSRFSRPSAMEILVIWD
mmetsp:Transcript_103948/g.155671  ORF Transcript_103948/g.155671 Transcript_103948/m.155671 type:complete len:240 (+) Transcript_103948:227-946(+)